MKKKDILVTGGAGYIGSHTLVELYNSGYRPIVVDNLSNGSIANIKGAEQIIKTKIHFYQIDCTDFDRMNKLFNEQNNIEAVIHFAAYKSVEESVRQPNKYFSNNVGSLETLIDLANKHNVNNIIFSSSCTVYGTPEFLPVNELEPFGKAESPYGETKQLCEKLIEKAKINSISLRYFNVSGSNYKKNIGEAHYPETHIIPLALQAALKNNYFNINGNNYQTPDGTCIRDYIHINDLCDAHLLSFKKLYSSNIKEFINIGAGRGFSVLEIIKSVKKITGYQILTKIVKKRLGDPDILVSKIEKSNKFLSWKPKVSDIETIILDSWEWYKIHKSF